MQPFVPLPGVRLLQAQWEHFTLYGVLPAGIDPFVMTSWRRCAPRLNASAAPVLKQLSEDGLERELRRNAVLRVIARPIMEDIYQYTESARSAILLLGSTLCILDTVGDQAITAELARMGFRQGVMLADFYIGTNAFSIAQAEHTPAWVYGPEHFLACLHGFGTAAAPVHNPDGSLLGVIGLFEYRERAGVASVGLANAAARAIEAQVQIELVRHESTTRAIEINSIIDSISDGLLAWDDHGIVHYINDYGSQLLNTRPSAVMGRMLDQFVTLPEMVNRSIREERDLTDVECTLLARGKPIDLIMNIRTARVDEDTLYLITFRPIGQVRELVSRQVGAVARQTIDDLIGESPPMQTLRRRIRAAAKAEAPVLLEGEMGTGKSTAGRAIHNGSSRRNGPFITMNCRAIPRDLVLAEFLGFEAGAYTNLNKGGQPSKFELGEGGTLYLDEIDALTLEMQAALLHILETGTVLRLGANRAVPVNVRIVTSTAANLEKLVEEGAFRLDLYYRLRAFHIHMPSLRQRKEDIPLLIRQKLTLMSAQMGESVVISERAMSALADYPWPGNIRELESALERALVLCESTTIDFEHLPPAVREGHLLPGDGYNDPIYSLAEAERLAIVRAGRAARGNLSRAAEMLGIARSTLWRKMHIMGITAHDFEHHPVNRSA